MVNDVIGDSLTRIRNAMMRGREETEIINTKITKRIAELLVENKFIDSIEVASDKALLVKFNATSDKNSEPAVKQITHLKRISKPGLRIYRGYKELKPILDGYGISIISTPKGVMTNVEARKNKAGGEVLCEIY